MRSEHELCTRLKKKKFDDPVIKETLAFLKEKGFINDQDFTRAWIESRLKRPFGLKRIRQELRLKGITEELIRSHIEALKGNYCEEEVVLTIAEERFNQLKGIEPQKARQRVFAYLMRRGFSSDAAIAAMHKLR